MKRKVCLLVFALLSVFFLTSLLQAADGWTGTIKVWDFPRPSSFAEWQQEVFRKFEEDYPGVKIEYTKLSWGKGLQKLDISVAANNPPDICGSGAKIKYALQGILEPIDPYLTESDWEDFYPAMLNAYKWDGQIWGWPMYSVMGVVVLNKDIFAERGVALPENGQWTWEEFVQTAQKLTFDRDGDGKTDVYGLVFHPADAEFWGLMYADGVFPLNEDMDEFTFNSPQAIASFEKIVNLIDTGVVPTHVGGFKAEQSWQFFAQQHQAAMTIQWAWSINSMKRYNQDIKDGKSEFEPMDWTIANYPTGKTGELITSSAGVGAWGVFKQKNQAKRDLVMELAHRLTSSEAQRETLWEIGTLPTRRSVADMYQDDPYISIVSSAQPIAVPFHPEWDKMRDIIVREMQLGLLGKASAEETLDNAAKKIEGLLK